MAYENQPRAEFPVTVTKDEYIRAALLAARRPAPCAPLPPWWRPRRLFCSWVFFQSDGQGYHFRFQSYSVRSVP